MRFYARARFSKSDRLLGFGWLEQLHPDDRQRTNEQWQATAARGENFDIEFRVRSRDGVYRWFRTLATPLRDEAGKIVKWFGSNTDIDDMKRADAALRESEERMRLATETTGVGIWEWNVVTNAIKWDAQMFRIYGLEPTPDGMVTYRDWADAVLPEDLPQQEGALQETVRQLGRGSREFRIRRRSDRETRFIQAVEIVRADGNGQPRWVVGTNLDITERLKSERLALRSQRLESLGTLAGGVAHDLNNALGPIMMSVELLRMQYPEESQLLDTIGGSAKRGADMVRQLLTFAKGAEGEKVLVQPSHLVKEMRNIMTGTFPKNIRLQVHYDPKLPFVLGDATQLHQVLLNLCVNARDAMPQGGTLTVKAERREVDAVYASSIPDAKPGKFVRLQVKDTGMGIPPEILDKIFDPFFTTKGPEKGTGLGLSTVLGIVKGHGGFLHIYSQPGEGSTFAVYLPAEGEESDTSHLPKAETAFRGNGETVLFVDDEAPMRETARAVLRRLNFTPLTATDGADALMQVAEHRADLRAVITDLHMPDMDGLAFARALRRLMPQIPIATASGRLEEEMAVEFASVGVTERLDKPFAEEQLVEVLKKLLAPK